MFEKIIYYLKEKHDIGLVISALIGIVSFLIGIKILVFISVAFFLLFICIEIEKSLNK